MDAESYSKIFESLMLISFGCAWPANILNTLRRKSAIGKSLSFLLIIIAGYIFGIAAKIVLGNINYVFFFYILNLLMVGFDLFLYFWYLRKDKIMKGSESP
jgi:lipopolysaccharide export LptBFGC system permease protein LptF